MFVSPEKRQTRARRADGRDARREPRELRIESRSAAPGRRGDPEGRYAPVNGSGTKTCLCHDARIREQLICRGVESISLVREGGGKGAKNSQSPRGDQELCE